MKSPEYSWYDLCLTFMHKKSFCELVLMTKTKEGLCHGGDLTDEQFTELKHLATINILGEKCDDDLRFNNWRENE